MTNLGYYDPDGVMDAVAVAAELWRPLHEEAHRERFHPQCPHCQDRASQLSVSG